MARRSILSQMASFGEDALGRLAQNPTTSRMMQSAVELKERVDDLARRVRGLEELEQRVEALEQRLDGLEGGGDTEPEPAPAETAATTTKSSGA
jgi:hypothetical protein